MKGLILSGGKGTRLRPITYTSAKQLVPVANRPVLFRVIERSSDAGITEIGIVVGDTAAEIEAAVGDGSRWGATRHLHSAGRPARPGPCRQDRRTVHRRRPLRHVPRRQRHPGRHHATWSSDFSTSGWNCQIVLKRVPDPRQFGVAELDGRPRHPPGGEAQGARPATWPSSASTCSTSTIFEAVDAIKPSFRGELEITDAIQYLDRKGLRRLPPRPRGLVDRHRQDGGHARRQPPGAG